MPQICSEIKWPLECTKKCSVIDCIIDIEKSYFTCFKSLPIYNFHNFGILLPNVSLKKNPQEFAKLLLASP